MRLVLGSAQLGMKYGVTNKNKINPKEIDKIKDFVKKKKLSYFDTSQNYGSAEKIIGGFNINNLKVVTKFKLPKNKKNIENLLPKLVLNSLKKTCVKKIYALLFHDPHDAFGPDIKIYIKTLKYLKNKGLIKYYGVSLYDPKDLKKILKLWKPDIVQVPVNILDQRFIKKKIIMLLKNKKIKIMARSCFLQGILIDENFIKSKFFKFEKKLNTFFKWCELNKISKTKACIDFIKQNFYIDYLIVGFNDVYQLEKIYNQFHSNNKIIPTYFKSNIQKLIDPRQW